MDALHGLPGARRATDPSTARPPAHTLWATHTTGFPLSMQPMQFVIGDVILVVEPVVCRKQPTSAGPNARWLGASRLAQVHHLGHAKETTASPPDKDAYPRCSQCDKLFKRPFDKECMNYCLKLALTGQVRHANRSGSRQGNG